MPLVGPLLRRQLWMGIADVLELVHGHAEGNEGQRLLQVGEAELVRLIAEEPLGIGIGELLHRHGVDLGDVGRLAVVIRDGLAAHGHIAGKGVASSWVSTCISKIVWLKQEKTKGAFRLGRLVM